MSIDQLILHIQELSKTPGDLVTLEGHLTAHGVDAMLKTNAASILDALAALDMHAHSLGCLYLLEARSRVPAPTGGDPAFFTAAGRFLSLCDGDQVRRAPRKLALLAAAFRASAVALGRPKHAIVPLRAALRALCPDPASISPIHADLYLVCLLSKCYSAPADILAEDAYLVDPGATGVSATDVLLASYYGGMLEAGRRRYARAAELFMTAACVPTQVVNAITVAALKKLHLVSLLATGTAPVLPKYVSVPVSRAMRSECGPYAELCRVAAAAAGAAAGAAPPPGLSTDLTAYALSKADVWRADGNAGLVRCVVEAGARRRVAALTKTFASLPAAGVAARAGLSGAREAELEVVRMVESGAVAARVAERDGMVSFSAAEGDGYASAETAGCLDALIARCMALSRAVAAADHSVSCDRAFLSKTDVGRGGGGGGSSGAGMGMTPNTAGAAMAMLREAAMGGGSGDLGQAMASPVVGELLDNLDEAMG